MKSNELVKVAMEKNAIAPIDTTGDKYDSLKNYTKEWLNRLIGGGVYGLGGAAVGAGMGAGIGRAISRQGAGLGALLGGQVGGVSGGLYGDVTSLRETERKTGVKPTGFGQYAGRSVTGNLFLGPVGDYLASRKLQKHPVVDLRNKQ